MLGVLSMASDARELYALPMLLPLSLLAAPGVNTLRRGAASALNWFSIMTFGFIAGVFWFFWFAMVSGHPAARAEHLLRLQPGYIPTFEPLHFAIALLATLAWLFIVFWAKSLPRNPRAVLNSATGITLVWVIMMTLWLPWLDAGKSYRSMIVSLQQALARPPRLHLQQQTGRTAARPAGLLRRHRHTTHRNLQRNRVRFAAGARRRQ